MAPQHSFIAERIDNTFCTSMKGWNKMFIAVIIVEVCMFGNTPGKLLDSIASLCCNILTWVFLKYIYNYVVFISRKSYALWNFSLNYPCSWVNLRIHCFPGSLLMFKLFRTILRIIFFSRLLLTTHRGKTCIHLWFKHGSNVSNTCC